MAALVILEDNGNARRFSCKEVTTIGRDPGNDVVLDDPHVSRRHALICRLQGGTHYLVDEGSSNGCYHNADRVTIPALLNHGDQISIGPIKLRFEQAVTASLPLDPRATMVTTHHSVEIVKIAILVADIRGFTRLSESMEVRQLTELMNEWFRAATECIQERYGTVDKFLGDCVYARWEANRDVAHSVLCAVGAACELNRLSRQLHNAHTELNAPLRIGVGINLGVAAIGTDKGRTALGDAVNIAFRLQERSKALHKDVVIADEAYKLLPETTWSGRERRVRVAGRTRPVDVLGLSFAEAEAMLRLSEEPQHA